MSALSRLELALSGELDSDDLSLARDIVELATAKGSLDWSPKENWVDQNGGLPKYIEEIALALIRDHGMTRERAIATAVNRVKKWASGVGDVKADTRAKAAAAVVQWQALKAKAAAKRLKAAAKDVRK